MGGPIAALMARDHPDAVSGVVMCATALEWQDPNQRVLLMASASMRLSLGLFPRLMWRLGVRRTGVRDARMRSWLVSEVSRGSARDLAEAGREIGRYEAASWIGEIGVPGAVVVTTDDTSVPPRKQRELAAALRGPVFEAEGSHFAVIDQPKRFLPALLEALGAVSAPGAVRAA
jgi:pimeloyl-ACP methyl ester carboxylesterase